MFWRTGLIIVVVGGLLLGCRRESDIAGVIPLRSNVIFAIDQDGQVRLSMWTTEVFPCLNYELRSGFRQSGRRIEVTIRGVVRPNTCIGGEGPARYVHPLGSLPAGAHELVINSQRQSDRYKISVVRGKIKIDPIRQSFTDYWR